MKVPLIVMSLLCAARCLAAAPSTAPLGLEGVGIEQRLGQRLPLDLSFRDETGRTIKLADCFHGRPILLTPVYFECPMLCTMTLNQLGRSISALKESAGEQFDIITFSFNPAEGPSLASAKKKNYLRSYRRPSAAEGWHFLTGDQASIDALTKAIGFNYRWDAKQQTFAHASAVLVIAPDGTISRYFLGVEYPPTELGAAIRDAGNRLVAPPAERVYFYCFKYDPETGKYGLLIGRSLRVLAVLVMVGVGVLIASLQSFSTRRARMSASTAAAADSPRRIE